VFFASPPQAAVGERSSRSASTAAAGGASTFLTIAKGPAKALLAELTLPSRATTPNFKSLSLRAVPCAAGARRQAPRRRRPGGVQGGAAPPLLHASTPCTPGNPHGCLRARGALRFLPDRAADVPSSAVFQAVAAARVRASRPASPSRLAPACRRGPGRPDVEGRLDGDRGQSLTAATRAHGSAPGAGRSRRPRAECRRPHRHRRRGGVRVDEALAHRRLDPSTQPAAVFRCWPTRRPCPHPFPPRRRRRRSRRSAKGSPPPTARWRRVDRASARRRLETHRARVSLTVPRPLGRRDPMATPLLDPLRRAADGGLRTVVRLVPGHPRPSQVALRATTSCPSPRWVLGGFSVGSRWVLERGPVRGGREPSRVYGSLRLEPRPVMLARRRQRRPRRRSSPPSEPLARVLRGTSCRMPRAGVFIISSTTKPL